MSSTYSVRTKEKIFLFLFPVNETNSLYNKINIDLLIIFNSLQLL